MARAAKVEKPSPLGDRVYKIHRKMISAIARKKRISNAKAVRLAIEETHERIVGK